MIVDAETFDIDFWAEDADSGINTFTVFVATETDIYSEFTSIETNGSSNATLCLLAKILPITRFTSSQKMLLGTFRLPVRLLFAKPLWWHPHRVPQ